MPEEIEITVENKLLAEKRDLNVYHHSTQSAHIISHNSSITLPLVTNGEGEKDYLDISVVKGPGYLERYCLIDIPAWADFDFTSKESVTGISLTHSHDLDGARTLLKIPPGPPAWELKITRPTRPATKGQFTKKGDYVVIGDNHDR
ncbi:MAG: hypothetical protein PVH61_37925 [Candidatus Aminicenantes bacterium]|jgi:hypothetical protein